MKSMLTSKYHCVDDVRRSFESGCAWFITRTLRKPHSELNSKQSAHAVPTNYPSRTVDASTSGQLEAHRGVGREVNHPTSGRSYIRPLLQPHTISHALPATSLASRRAGKP